MERKVNGRGGVRIPGSYRRLSAKIYGNLKKKGKLTKGPAEISCVGLDNDRTLMRARSGVHSTPKWAVLRVTGSESDPPIHTAPRRCQQKVTGTLVAQAMRRRAPVTVPLDWAG